MGKLKFILIGIIVLGFFLRIIGITDHPSGFNADEASFGYDAYSILKTGKDQWGNTLPLVLKSFGDDKLPLYTYITIPSIYVFGLNEFSVRLPGVVLGTLSILGVYLLVRELTKNNYLALMSSVIMAINPWHLMLSRGAFESNLTNFFLPIGVYLFIKGKKYVYVSFIFFFLNIFTYHTARILTPLLVLFLITVYKDKLKLENKFKFTFLFTIILFTVSLFGILLGGSRISTSSLADINFLDDRYNSYLTGESALLSKFFYNKPLYIVRQFVTNYLSYFSPQFLFLTGAGEGTYGMVPGVGVFYIVELIFLGGFIVKLIKERVNKEFFVILFWLIISFVPAALTKGPGYAGNRASIAIVPVVIVISVGGFYLYNLFKNKNAKRIFVFGCFSLFLLNFVYFGERYWIGQTANHSQDMTYGMKEVMSQVGNSKNVIISRAISEPQIFVAFYNKIDPIIYQQEAKKWRVVNGWVDQQGEYSLLNYSFKDINYSVDKKLEGTTIVSLSKDFPPDIKPDIVINYPNLKTAYYIVKTK